MPEFSSAEISLICIYDPGNLTGLIYELRSAAEQLIPYEQDQYDLMMGLVAKLETMTTQEYEWMNDGFYPEFGEVGYEYDCGDGGHAFYMEAAEDDEDDDLMEYMED